MTSTETRPDVAAFVADVRARLADLSDEQREDLLEGLEADLFEQVADGGSAVLADPASYAAELRAAAGLPVTRRRLPSMPQGVGLGRGLDRLHERWSSIVDPHPTLRRVWPVFVALRPVWWALRAWVAVTVVDQAVGTYEGVTVVPTILLPGLGFVVLVAAVVASALVGLGALRPGWWPAHHGVSRLVLVVVNVVAAAAFVSLAGQSSANRYGFSGSVAVPSPGVTVDGRSIRNIYPYDAQGQPITTGVQLFDGAGRPIALSAEQAAGLYSFHDASGIVGCPWVNGTQRLYNVFPLPERDQRRFTVCQERFDARRGPAVLPESPLTQVPPVALPAAP